MRQLFLTSSEALLPVEDVVVERVLWTAAAAVGLVALVTANGPLLAGLALVGAAVWARGAWASNVVEREFRLTIDEAWSAAVTGLRENGESVVGRARLSPTDGRIESRRARIDVERQRGGLVRLRIRVGLLPTADNRRVADLILESAERWVRNAEV